MSTYSDELFTQAVGQPPDPDAPMIEFRDLHKSFGDRTILNGVDLKIERGETMVIIGRSGTGKSVSMKVLIGLLKPDRGRVFVKGRDITDLPEENYAVVRRMFGVLFQSGALINWMTIGQNVGLPLREHTDMDAPSIEKKVREMLALFEMSHAYDLMPNEISGGMKKRAGLARGLVLDPQVMLYDEPTSGLDPVMSSSIDVLVRKVQKQIGMTSIFVTHDMESAYTVGDRISMLYNGRIIYTGTSQETRNSDHPIVKQFVHGSLEGPITADLAAEEGRAPSQPATAAVAAGGAPHAAGDAPGDAPTSGA